MVCPGLPARSFKIERFRRSLNILFKKNAHAESFNIERLRGAVWFHHWVNARTYVCTYVRTHMCVCPVCKDMHVCVCLGRPDAREASHNSGCPKTDTSRCANVFFRAPRNVRDLSRLGVPKKSAHTHVSMGAPKRERPLTCRGAQKDTRTYIRVCKLFGHPET